MSKARRQGAPARRLKGAIAADQDQEQQRKRAKPWHALCQCEIANFVLLRRHLGRPRADALVHDVTSRILAHIPDIRVVGSGRNLVEITFDRPAIEGVAADLARIERLFAGPLDLDGESHRILLRIGGSAVPRGDCDDVRLTESAESALDQARIDQSVVLFDLSRADLAFDRLSLMRELPAAITNGEMFLQYQPKVHVRRQQVTSAEALVRWRHPQRGLILPGDFIAIAEQAGEIAALTLWTFRQVIADQKRLCDAGYDLLVFVNISGVLLADAAFVDAACGILATHPEARLGFEITETAVIRDPDSAIRHLQRFADNGVALAIDDYGAGLSSLAYLKQLPARELKIDKMFVTQITSSNRDPLIVRSTIDLAHALDMEVTAEGVETPSALALLTVMGCDMVQGYLISRPIELEAFIAYLDQQAHHLTAAGAVRSSFVRPESFWKRA